MPRPAGAGADGRAARGGRRDAAVRLGMEIFLCRIFLSLSATAACLQEGKLSQLSCVAVASRQESCLDMVGAPTHARGPLPCWPPFMMRWTWSAARAQGVGSVLGFASLRFICLREVEAPDVGRRHVSMLESIEQEGPARRQQGATLPCSWQQGATLPCSIRAAFLLRGRQSHNLLPCKVRPDPAHPLSHPAHLLQSQKCRRATRCRMTHVLQRLAAVP